MALGLGGLTAFVVSVLAAVVVIRIFLTKKKSLVRKTREGQNYRVQTTKVATRLSLSEIESATMGFHRDRLVGEGASAKVCKGSLPSGGDVAVKRFERVNGIDCLRNPFTTEFATMVGCLRQKNLVQLQGWCCEGPSLLVVSPGFLVPTPYPINGGASTKFCIRTSILQLSCHGSRDLI